ncbi:S-layer homology domain-containing protein [Lysinibacillus sp. G01H]|uniref:S-layer homology domain-containing protein n=1 Tax=Lysinibacillus sp. G01H TaxID=3026425 RepID=UPI00237D760D|nr:S-layer homology domain-containing protein [Lysinibacillus sp. G01H]WDU80162.1 S-layer homology domain-containing protein [Lysinibacillus sp. G01H]
MAKQNKGRKFFAASATAALVASAIVPVASAAQVNDYNKISGYAKEAVQSLVDAGVIQGDTNGNFNPLNTVTRAQAAEIFTKALELEADGDVNFSDVKKGAWYYNSIAAVVANGIFEGVSANEFAPNKSLTRSEAAKVLVDAFGLEGSESLSQFADASQVKPWAKDALETAVANGIFTGSEENGKLNLKPNAAITRQDFAVVFARTLDLAVETVDASIKAINNTTVEVTFDEEVNVDDVKAANFKIDGLEVKNASVKQTNKKVVVLTTEAQTADKDYVLSYKDEEIGKFKGVAAVIPTAVKLTTSSVQGVIGNEVTLKAQVTVAEGQSKAGIPVTFNIVNDKTTNDKVEVEALTDENGVATYSYTRYYSSVDSVTAYATSKSSVYSSAKVYWANALQLTVKDITEATTLVNGAKKVYEINSKDNANGYVFVAFEENLDVAPNKAVTGAKVEGLNTYVLDSAGKLTATTNVNGYPYAYTTGGKAVTAVKLDGNGKANLVVTGSNAAVTPIVYSKGFVDATKTLVGVDADYSATALQTKASTVKFELKHELGLTIQAEGVQNSATYLNDTETGGRDYTVTYTDKNGKVAAPGTKVKVAIDTKGVNGTLHVLDADNKELTYTTSATTPGTRYYEVTVEKEGKAKFTVSSTNVNDYVTPVVFIDNGKSTAAGALDADDLQAQGEITYFVADVTYAAKLSAVDAAGKEVKAVVANGVEYADFVYSLVDQNGKPRRSKDGNATTVSFEVKAGTGTVTVDGTTVIQPGGTKTVNATIPSNGTKASVRVVAQNPSSVTVSATGSRAGVVLPSTNPASVAVDFSQYGTAEVTGYAKAVNTSLDVLSINNVVYNYANAVYKQNGNVIDLAAFESLIVGNNAYVSITKDSADKFTFNVIPAPGQTVVNTAKATTATNLDITFTSTPVVTDGTQFWVDHDDDTSTPMVQGTVAAVTGKVVSVTFGAGTFTKADIGEVQYIPSATLASRLTLDGVRADSTITISDANTTSAIVVAGNQSTFGAGAVTPFVVGAKAVKQTEVLTIGAQPTASGNLRVNLTDKDGTVFNGLINGVVNADSEASVATKVATLLQNTVAVTNKYDVTLGTGTDAAKVTLTAKNAAANDPALVLTVEDDTATIGTQTSTDGLAGVATSVAQIVDVAVTGATNATSPVEPVTVAINQVSADLGNFSLTKTVNVTNTSTTATLASSIVSALNNDASFSARFVASVSPIDATLSTVRITNKDTGVVTSTTFTITP